MHAITMAKQGTIRTIRRSSQSLLSKSASPSLEQYPDQRLANQFVHHYRCFRCLLACGLQLMLPRAIARMACLTAAQLKVRLPDAVEKLLHFFKEDAWHPSDVHQLSSAWPRWTPTNKQTSQGDAPDMENLLRQWQALDVQEKALDRDDEVEAADALNSTVLAKSSSETSAA